MKNSIIPFFIIAVLLSSCGNNSARSVYRAVLPALPEHWEAVLGEAHWRLEWFDEDGMWREMEFSPGRNPPDLTVLREWASPVLAWPFWPSRGLLPGMMRPAGALFPWDVSGDRVNLSWKAGVEAVFWDNLAAAERLTEAAEGRLPWHFNWPRFRELLETGNIPENVRDDLWLADWKDIAARTIQSGFDSRRIRSRAFTEIAIPGLGGTWINSSPFVPPLDAGSDGPLRVNAGETPDTWVSAAGLLKCSVSGWVIIGE